MIGEVTEVEKTGLFMVAIVTLPPAPPSVTEILVPAVKTLSSVKVALVAKVTYWASVGAPPPTAAQTGAAPAP